MKLTSQLSIKQSQKLVMNQSLQHAIRVLQLNQQDLQQEVADLLDSNIMLEMETDVEQKTEAERESVDESPEESLNLDEAITVEADWDYHTGDGSTSYSASASEDDYDPLNMLTDAHRTTVHEDLMWQLEMGVFSEMDYLIGAIIISELTEDGFFETPLATIVELLKNKFADIDEDDVAVVLRRIQKFSPSGIAARNLEESLINQIKERKPEPSWAQDAITLLEDGVDDLVRLNINKLVKLVGGDEEYLRSILNELRQLNPKPGYKVGSDDIGGIQPEIIVTLDQNKINVELNEDIVPRLRINQQYAQFARKQTKDSEVLREHLGQAQNFIRSIHSRFDTLLAVAREVVEYQQAFFFEGESGIKPLQLKDIAEKLDLNESTISRAVSGKYLLCPTGTFELKFFFSNQVVSSAGDGEDDPSGVAIRAALQEIIDSENPEKPYSDSRLAKLLEEKGYKIARRTVTKYREVLGVASSTNRRRIA